MRDRNRDNGKLGLSAFEKSYELRNGKQELLNYKDLVKVFGRLRLEQYKATGRSIEKIVSYFLTEDISEHSDNGFQANLIGAEGNVLVMENLIKSRAKNVEMEIPYKDTKVDVVANVSNNIQMNFIARDGKEVSKALPKGDNAFEVKSSVELSEKVEKQAVKIRGRYKNCHVLVLADTKVSNEIINKLYDDRCDIVRAAFTRKDIIKRLLNLQRELKTYIKIQ